MSVFLNEAPRSGEQLPFIAQHLEAAGTPVPFGHHLYSLHPSLDRRHHSACLYLPTAPPGSVFSYSCICNPVGKYHLGAVEL